MKPLLPGIPGPLSLAFLVIAGLMLFLVYDQQYWWNLKEDYTFGYIVPIFVGYVLYDRWQQVVGAVSKPLPGPANPLASALLKSAAALAILAGTLLFLF